MNLLNKLNPKQYAIVLFAVFYAQLANAGFGQKFAQKLNQFNDELVIIAAVAFVTGVICLAITLLGGGNEKVKRWGVGLIVAGILVFVAPDLGNFFFN